MDLQRHQLVHLGDAGWRAVLTPADDPSPWDAQALDCLQYWAARDLPLVVTRQGMGFDASHTDAAWVLGLAAPLRWDRRRIFVSTRGAAVARFSAFPAAIALVNDLPAAQQLGWRALCAALGRLGVPVRVYGSHGWQHLSGLPTVREDSDIDLLLPVRDAVQADAVVERLQVAGIDGPRLDGELIFTDGTAVAWREWAAWRAGQTARVLVKRLCGAAVEDPRQWLVAA